MYGALGRFFLMPHRFYSLCRGICCCRESPGLVTSTLGFLGNGIVYTCHHRCSDDEDCYNRQNEALENNPHAHIQLADLYIPLPQQSESSTTQAVVLLSSLC